MSLLELSAVTKSFAGVTALRGVNLSVPDGVVFGLIGPNGAGKTTLVNVASGYLSPTEGTVRFAGTDVGGLRPHQVAAAGLARTYQNLRLFEEATVLENVLIGRHLAFRGRPWQLLGRRGAEEREQRAAAMALVDRLGLTALAGAVVAALPYGLRRRVEVARALALDPKLLLLDEPTAGMTRAESDDIAALIKKVADSGVTVVLVEHNVRLVTNTCEQVAVLDFGEVIASGPPEQVWADERVRDAYLGRRSKAATDAP